MLRLFPNANYKFIEIRRIAYIITAVVLGLCLAIAIFHQVTKGSWLNYGVDFAGGTLVQVDFPNKQVTDAQLRELIEPRLPGTEITEFGHEHEFLLRTRFSHEGKNSADEIVSILNSNFGKGDYTLVRTEAVGPKVGNELQRKAAVAVILALVAVLAYLAVRFEWRFGLAAVIATAHDTFITLGLISVFQLEVSLTTVAAILTILGYSLHDTIIIFDRIRENLKKYGRKASLIEIMDRSINETLPRSVLTVGTVVVTLLSLALLGGPAISGFAMIMLVGVMIGAYSSIFVASPVLYEIETRWAAKPGAKTPRQRVAL